MENRGFWKGKNMHLIFKLHVSVLGGMKIFIAHVMINPLSVIFVCLGLIAVVIKDGWACVWVAYLLCYIHCVQKFGISKIYIFFNFVKYYFNLK